ncbi:DUF2399 domain-containing protein [Streptomyces acidicola]|uniref:DUF2399 domain-containing protein n=1 Tax=Streptomyces acidicola TaxID=2596892 RepID=UPI0037B4DAA7
MTRLAAATREAGRTLHWRADSDWTGLRITADAVRRHAARPWRMTAQAYAQALAEGDSVPSRAAPRLPMGNPRSRMPCTPAAGQ